MDKVWAVWGDLCENFREAFSFLRERDHQRNLIIVSTIALAYVMPIVIANVPYGDDLWRLYKGATWVQDARFLNDFIFKTLSFWGPIPHNFAPYSQVIGALLFTWTGYLLGVLLVVKNNATRVLTSLVLLTFPFTLGNLIWQWEPLYMGLCSLILLIPFLFQDKQKYYFSVSLLALLFCAFTYQSFFPLYPISVAFLTIRLIGEEQEKKAIRIIILSILAVVIFAILYVIIMRLVMLSPEIVSRMGMYDQRVNFAFGLPLLLNGIDSFFSVIKSIYNFSGSILYYFPVFLGFFVLLSFAFRNLLRNSTQKLNKGLMVLCFVSIPFLAFSLLILLKSSGGLRTYFPVTFSLVGYLFLISWFYPKWANAFSFLLILFSFFMISPLTQVQKHQWEFDKSLLREMMANLDAERIKEIVVAGEVPYSAQSRQWLESTLMYDKYLKDEYLREDYFHVHYFVIFLKYLDLVPDSLAELSPLRRKEIVEARLEFPIIKKKLHYWIREKDGTVIIDFRKDETGEREILMGKSLKEVFSQALGFFK